MRNKKLLIYFLLLFIAGCATVNKTNYDYWKNLPILEEFKKDQRILILAPHPDDESIACAGVIQKALSVGAQVKIVYLTNGDHNELSFIVYEKRLTMRQGEFVHMGKVRQKEAIKAMKFLGLSEDNLVFLGYPDFGTFNIFCNHWQTKKPFRDRLTRISNVPYKDSPSYGASYSGENILKDLTHQILSYQPDIIFVSHPADVNVDHKSLYLFLQIVLSDLTAQIPTPKVYPYLVHTVGWPKPRHYHPELEIYPPDKFIGSSINWQRLNLSMAELDKKYKSILLYKSQTQVSAFYLLAFARRNELFGDYPVLDLAPKPLTNDAPITYLGISKMFKDTQEWTETQDEPDVAQDNELVSYAQEDDYFIVRLDLPKQLGWRFGVMLYIFGYNSNIPFAQMPKIRIITSGRAIKVLSGKETVVNSGVLLDLNKDYLILKVPFKLLNDPDYLLTSLKMRRGNLTIDAVGYRKIRINPDVD
ncbi:MAG: PIG-L family deacetylase [Candidatus Omnitrophota bacterium]